MSDKEEIKAIQKIREEDDESFFKKRSLAKRKYKWSRGKEILFLKELADTGSYVRAAKRVGVSTSFIRGLRERVPEFELACQDALEIANDRLEQEAVRRAIEGWEDPVFFQGQEVGKIRRYSDSLLKFLMSHRIDKYKKKQKVEIEKNINVTFSDIPEEKKLELKKLAMLRAKMEIEKARKKTVPNTKDTDDVIDVEFAEEKDEE